MIETLDNVKIYYTCYSEKENIKCLYLKHKYGLFLNIIIKDEKVIGIEFAAFAQGKKLDLYELLFNETILKNVFINDVYKYIGYEEKMKKKIYEEFKEFFVKKYLQGEDFL